MLSRDMYTEQYIRDLQLKTGNDPALLERILYAFGLLEAICQAGLPFCFKGGTSLMLLLDHPGRLSTDIDIIVEPGTDIDAYVRRAGEIFPFIDVEEQARVGKSNIAKRHFRFRYCSPLNGRDVNIVLDVVLEKIPYGHTITVPIHNELLMTEGENLSVVMPDVNGLLGDKLTAFAPHTTGVPFGVGKELEIMKQLYDCSLLFDAMTDYTEVKQVYDRVVRAELNYRGLALTPRDVLKDTVEGCLCIAARGVPEGDYRYYMDGISRIRSHILNGKFSGELAGACACRVLYLAVSMLTGQEEIRKKEDAAVYSGQKISMEKPRRFSYLRIVDPTAYGYMVEAAALLKNLLSGADISVSI